MLVFSEVYVVGYMFYVAGQQGPDEHGKVPGTDITLQTTNTIAAIRKIVEGAGFKIPEQYCLQPCMLPAWMTCRR